MPVVGPYYAQDSYLYRTQDELVKDFEEFWGEETNNRRFRLPTHKIVCPQCDGKGTMVNRSIDGQGLSMEDFYEDPDFAEDYFSGVYDVRCDECRGQNVVDTIDYDSLSPELQAAWDEYVNDYHSGISEHLAELRFGA